MGCTHSSEPNAPRRNVDSDNLRMSVVADSQKAIQRTAQPLLSLMTIDPDTIPDVICKDAQTNVYVYDVHDGDTVHFIMMLGDTPVKLALRLLGIDTPELRGGEGHLLEEKRAAEMARNRLAAIINAPVLAKNAPSELRKPLRQSLTTIIIRDWDKFGGRVLGEIITPDGRSAADILIAEGYGRKYNGEKKKPWTMEDLSVKPFLLL